MAHFYGSVKGSRGETSRLGSANSGLTTICASWSGAVQCSAYVNSDGEDCVIISFRQWKNGRGTSATIYDGPISGAGFRPEGGR